MSAGAMEAGSSKVTVEYHDPSGVFPLISRDLASRLPLRNLNWQSPSRPLRQIRQLHVEFVPDKLTEATLRAPVQRFDSNGPTSLEIVRGGKDARKEAVKERRHQIPGLKTSPYLKLYVLRCDDKDVYKATERQRIRDWLRDEVHGDSKRGENHEAFEWLILHVVVPDTVAASESRWRQSKQEPDELKERKTSNVKFPGKSTRTVFDRLRADFNDSSKAGQDRVSQIRLLKSVVPPDLLPTPAVAETLEETAQERELSWKDLTDKLKILILGPFDARVRQYEADIAGQEARRSLPGWNFCTFFINKEGLAKALESIGLVEDALAIYDELAVGLETAVRDIAAGQAEGTATTFAAYTDDVEERILGRSNGVTNGNHVADSKRDFFSKDYREKIVRSDISVFDFFCYLFSRQKALILRLANTRASRAELGALVTGDGGEDLVLVSEVCWRASSFIHNTARTLRYDLSYSLPPADVNALVCSWTYIVSDQILAETAAPVLDLANSDSKTGLNGAPATPKRSDFSFAMGSNPYPQRMSSLGIRKPAPELQRPPTAPRDSFSSPPSSSGTDVASKGAGIPGLPELATYRAELVMLQRKMVEQLAMSRGWVTGWASLRLEKPGKLEEVSLEDNVADDAQTEKNGRPPSEHAVSAKLPVGLATSLQSEEDFRDAYQSLCDTAMRYFALATQNKSVEVIIGDLVMLKRQQGDYETAENYLKHLLPSYNSDGWNAMEADVLGVYADCLKHLGRQEEYLKVMLDLLAMVCGRKMARRLPSVRLNDAEAALELGETETSGMLADVCAVASKLPSATVRSLDDYFDEVRFEREITHLNDKDGFGLRFRIRHVLLNELPLDRITARLVSIDDPNVEIWLTSDSAVELQHGLHEFNVETTTNAFGAFELHTLTLEAKQLHFTKDYKAGSKPSLRINNDFNLRIDEPVAAAAMAPTVFVYPAHRAFDIQVTAVREIFIDRPRILEIRLSSGWNDLQSVDVKVRPTSAGLRLHLGDATYDSIEVRSDEEKKSGQLSLSSLGADRIATIKLPYTVEQATPDISMRFDVRYRTARGSFTYLSTAVLRHELPLDVDVNDTFRLDALYSNFTIRTMHDVPLAITETGLQESPVYAVYAPPQPGTPMLVFGKSPAKLVYRITRKSTTAQKLTRRNAALALKLRYIAVDELIVAAVRESFIAQLHGSEAQAVSRLLLPFLGEHCKQRFQGAEIEMVAILGEVRVPPYEDFRWDDLIGLMPPALRSQVSSWLRMWHKHTASIPIEYGSETARDVARIITIAVEVPTVDIVFNTSLNVHSDDTLSAPGAQVLKLGKPVRADISVSHTDAWSAQSIYGQARKGPSSFVLDLQVNNDIWLIGGPRRAHFDPTERESLFRLLMVPLKVGTCFLPLVDVQVEPELDDDGQRDKEALVSCETHYEDGAKTVEVIRDLRITRMHVADTPGSSTFASRPGTATEAIAEPG